MKKAVIFLILGFWGITLTAQEGASFDDMKKEKVSSFCHNKKYCDKPCFKTSRPEVQGEDYFVFGQILYFIPKIGGTAFAANQIKSFDSFPIRGSIKENKFDWNSGFRVGIGKKLKEDDLDICLDFSCYTNHSSTIKHKLPPASLFPIQGYFGGSFERAKSTFDLVYLNLNLRLGRAYFLSPFFSLNPKIGLHGIRLLQRQECRFNFSPLESGGVAMGEFYYVDGRCDANGIGPEISIESSYLLGNGFCFFQNTLASLIYEYAKIYHKERTSYHASIYNVNIRLNGNKHYFSPFIQMQMGLSWGKYLFDKTKYLLLKIGYEAQYFYRQNQMIVASDSTIGNNNPPSTRLEQKYQAEDISMHGLFVSARIDF